MELLNEARKQSLKQIQYTMNKEFKYKWKDRIVISITAPDESLAKKFLLATVKEIYHNEFKLIDENNER